MPSSPTRCNHCGVYFVAETVYFSAQKEPDRDGRAWESGLERAVCPHCNRQNLWVAVVELVHENGGIRRVARERRLIYPSHPFRAALHPSVPPELAADYTEALQVLPLSPKASAALSRRCLQHLLTAHGYNGKDLAGQIAAVLASGLLPSDLEAVIDSIRVVGNFAAHPMKSQSTGQIVDVEPTEAEWNLEVLEQLFDYLYARPAMNRERLAKLNEKLKDAGLKPLKGANAATTE